MVPMTDPMSTADRGAEEFYDTLAPDYDLMTGFEKRFVHERPFFRLLVDNHGIRTALDAGSGSGFHSLLLAQLGVDVTAVDISTLMLKSLASHAQELKLKVEIVQSSFQQIAGVLHKRFDALFCLGNSLAHMLTEGDLAAALIGFRRLVRPGGIIFLQILNYARILAHKERIQSVKQSGDATFVRFYDFEKALLRFNILKLEKRGVEPTLNSTLLRPILEGELKKQLGEAGYEAIKVFGSIAMEEFSPENSRDLVVRASVPV